MTTYDDENLESSEAREPSLDELLGEVLGLVDEMVAARLAGGELGRRRARIKADADRGTTMSPAPGYDGGHLTPRLVGLPSGVPVSGGEWPDGLQVTLAAGRGLISAAEHDAEKIRGAARQDAQRYQDAALKHAAETVVAARQEAEQILAAARQEAEQEAEQILAAARQEAEQILAAARQEAVGRGGIETREATADEQRAIDKHREEHPDGKHHYWEEGDQSVPLARPQLRCWNDGEKLTVPVRIL